MPLPSIRKLKGMARKRRPFRRGCFEKRSMWKLRELFDLPKKGREAIAAATRGTSNSGDRSRVRLLCVARVAGASELSSSFKWHTVLY